MSVTGAVWTVCPHRLSKPIGKCEAVIQWSSMHIRQAASCPRLEERVNSCALSRHSDEGQHQIAGQFSLARHFQKVRQHILSS